MRPSLRLISGVCLVLIIMMSLTGGLSHADEKIPAPAGTELIAARRLVNEVYGELIGARAADQKAAAARLLITRAHESADKPAARYALYEQAKLLAMEAGDIDTAIDAIDGLDAHYQGDWSSERMNVVQTLARGARSDGDHQAVAAAGLRVVDDLVREQRFDDALGLLKRTRSSALRSKRPELAAAHRELPISISKIKTAAGKVEEDRQALAKNPDDAQLNLSVGKFTALYLGDWPTGLAMLEKGADPTIANAAKHDLDGSSEPAGMASIGDRWWALAETAGDSTESAAYRKRAASWYGQAIADLQGIERGRLINRMTPATGIHWGDLTLKPGLKIKRTMDNKDASATNLPAKATPEWQFKSAPPNANQTIQLYFNGYLRSPSSIKVRMKCSCIGGKIEVQVNGRNTLKGNGHSEATVSLNKGYNAVQGVLSIAVQSIARPDMVPSVKIEFFTEDGELIPFGPESWFHDAN